jgi:FkbM family methyltransferase
MRVHSLISRQFLPWIFSRGSMTRVSNAFLRAVLHSMGIDNYESERRDERLFLRKIAYRLPRDPVIFDVGANEGQYARIVREAMPGARIFSFEPGPTAFERLKVAKIGGVFVPIQAALGAIEGETVLFDYKERAGSEFASLIPGVIEQFRGAEAQEISVAITTLDAFARRRSIDKIDLLKIDVEGAELGVLQGAREMIATRRIRVLQIEFTEMNLLSRTFFRDFAAILPDHRFYRILRNGDLLDLSGKRPIAVEIFAYQNLVALPCLP